MLKVCLLMGSSILLLQCLWLDLVYQRPGCCKWNGGSLGTASWTWCLWRTASYGHHWSSPDAARHFGMSCWMPILAPTYLSFWLPLSASTFILSAGEGTPGLELSKSLWHLSGVFFPSIPSFTLKILILYLWDPAFWSTTRQLACFLCLLACC